MSSAPPNCHPRPKSRLLLPTSSRGFYLSFHLKKDQNFPPYIFSPEGNFQLDSSKGKHEFHPHIMQSLKSFRRCFSHPSLLGSPFYLSIKEHTQSSIFNFVDNVPLYLGEAIFSQLLPKRNFSKKSLYSTHSHHHTAWPFNSQEEEKNRGKF